MSDGKTIYFEVPRVGFNVKFCDFDFASIGKLIENDKVEAEWTKKYFINSRENKYYDMHYLFN